MSRKHASPPFEAGYIGALDVSAADANWAAVNSEDMEDLSVGAGASLPAGLVLVSVTVYNASSNDARLAFADRSGDAADKDNSVLVPAGGAAEFPLRGINGRGPDAFSYAAGAAADALYLTAYWDAA